MTEDVGSKKLSRRTVAAVVAGAAVLVAVAIAVAVTVSNNNKSDSSLEVVGTPPPSSEGTPALLDDMFQPDDSNFPTNFPTNKSNPSVSPTNKLTDSPTTTTTTTNNPSTSPTNAPTALPTSTPTSTPSVTPSSSPSPPVTTYATTTRYWDCSGGACGCAYLPFGDQGQPAHCYSNGMFEAPQNNEYGASFYGTAAVSEALTGLGGSEEDAFNFPSCGKCFKVTGTSNVGTSSGVDTTLVLKAANVCPPENEACCCGKVHFDIAAPGFDVEEVSLSNTCAEREFEELEGFQSCGRWLIGSSDPEELCDCSLFKNPVLRKGCESFFSLKWNNPIVEYEEVNCPLELSRQPCWEENGFGYPDGDTIPDFCGDPYYTASPPNPFCCSYDYKICPENADEFCDASEESCLGLCQGKAYIDPSTISCGTGLLGECTNDPDSCCEPLVCKGTEFYSSCQLA